MTHFRLSPSEFTQNKESLTQNCGVATEKLSEQFQDLVLTEKMLLCRKKKTLREHTRQCILSGHIFTFYLTKKQQDK
jgi:hypothetical protein